MSLKILYILPFLALACVHGGAKNEKEAGAGYAGELPFRSISRLKAEKPSSGSFNTAGYVVKIYTCPPCPEGAMCKPCMRDNIVISEDKKLLSSYALTGREVVVFFSGRNNFRLGGRYRFSVKVLDHSTTAEPLNDIELLGYEPAPEKIKQKKAAPGKKAAGTRPA